MIHLGNLALSGAGLLIVEATAVQPEGRITPQDLGLWNDQQAERLAGILQSARRYSSIKFGIQLAHAGRKASTDVPWRGGKPLTVEQGAWQTVAPSALPYADAPAPQAMSLQQIEEFKQAFVDAAKRAEQAGFELIEIHAAHGYLLHEFLSPLSNQRQDQYGGSLANRWRLLLEIYQAVRAAVSNKIAVGVRISGTDWVTGGWDLQQSVELAKQLETLGCDFIHVSSAGLAPEQQIPVGPNFQVPLAQQIQQAVKMPTIAVGLITEPEQAEAIVATGQAELVAIGRGMLYDPRWAWHAAVKLGVPIAVAPQYLRSEPYTARGLFTLPQD